MKSLKIFSTAIMVLLLCEFSFAQKTTTETLKVSGVCGMCKRKIEKAAKEAGASYAVWSTTSKVLTIKYNSLSTNSAKIQQNIADAGYDTPDFKATDEAYDKLDACCQYDRTASNDEKPKDMSCCSGDKSKMDCSDKGMKGAKMDCSDKNAKGSKMDCCNKATSAKTQKQQ